MAVVFRGELSLEEAHLGCICSDIFATRPLEQNHHEVLILPSHFLIPWCDGFLSWKHQEAVKAGLKLVIYITVSDFYSGCERGGEKGLDSSFRGIFEIVTFCVPP